MKAFPSKLTGTNDKNEKVEFIHTGMDLRDYFAAKAMQGLMSTQHIDGAPNNESVATWAYAVADEMMEARNGK